MCTHASASSWSSILPVSKYSNCLSVQRQNISSVAKKIMYVLLLTVDKYLRLHLMFEVNFPCFPPQIRNCHDDRCDWGSPRSLIDIIGFSFLSTALPVPFAPIYPMREYLRPFQFAHGLTWIPYFHWLWNSSVFVS